MAYLSIGAKQPREGDRSEIAPRVVLRNAAVSVQFEAIRRRYVTTEIASVRSYGKRGKTYARDGVSFQSGSSNRPWNRRNYFALDLLARAPRLFSVARNGLVETGRNRTRSLNAAANVDKIVRGRNSNLSRYIDILSYGCVH